MIEVSGLASDLLREIYYASLRQHRIELSELEVLTGLSPTQLRPALEDLKQGRLIIENQDRFETSHSGADFCSSRWV